MRVFKGTHARFNFAFTDMWQADEEEDCGQKQEDDAKNEIGHLDRVRAGYASLVKVLEDQIAANQRSGGRSKRIESLRQIQAAGRRAFWPKNGHIRICRDLQHRKAK